MSNNPIFNVSFNEAPKITVPNKSQLLKVDCERDLADYIVKNFISKKCVCTSKESKDTFYIFTGVRWVEDTNNKCLYDTITDTTLQVIVKTINDLEADYKKAEQDKKEIFSNLIKKFKGKVIKYCQKKTSISEVMYHVGMIVRDNLFYDKLDSNPNLLGFENGVYDLARKEFRKAKPSDYLSFSTGINFPEEKDYGHRDEVLDFFSKIFPSEELRNYLLQYLAQSLCGQQKIQALHVHTGTGANGKSILTKLMLNTFGDYAVSVNSSLITQRNNDTHSNGNPVLHDLKGRRFVYATETKKKDHLNENFIKNFTGGDQQKYRLLFSNQLRTFFPQADLNLFCNKMPTTDGEDGGMARRLRVIPYLSKFVSEDKVDEENHKYLMDYTLEVRVSEWKYDFMNLLISLYDHHHKDNPPKVVLDLTSEYLDENNSVKEFIKNFITITNNKSDYITLKHLKEVWRTDNLPNIKDTDLRKGIQTELPDIQFRERVKINKKDIRSAFVGVKLNYDEDPF